MQLRKIQKQQVLIQANSPNGKSKPTSASSRSWPPAIPPASIIAVRTNDSKEKRKPAYTRCSHPTIQTNSKRARDLRKQHRRKTWQKSSRKDSSETTWGQNPSRASSHTSRASRRWFRGSRHTRRKKRGMRIQRKRDHCRPAIHDTRMTSPRNRQPARATDRIRAKAPKWTRLRTSFLSTSPKSRLFPLSVEAIQMLRYKSRAIRLSTQCSHRR